MSEREFPEWMYAVPDARTTHIRELEAALLESNDGAAKLRPHPATVNLLREVAHARAIGLEQTLVLEFAIDEWISVGRPGLET